MLIFEKHKLFFDPTRCTQCGACIAACDKDALSAKLLDNGLYDILINEEVCTRCGSCVVVCPAKHLANRKIGEGTWDKLSQAVLSYSRNDDIRRNASSGGAARMVLAGAVETGLCDLAYSLRSISEYPWAEGSFFTNPVNLNSIPGSLYLPILAMKNLRFDRMPKSLVLIGTCCQLIGATQLLKGTVEHVFKIALFCKQQKTLASTLFIAKRMGITPENIKKMKHIRYRGNGWPGDVCIDGRCIPWEDVAALPYGKRLWRIPGCRTCPNPFGVDVDLTLADPWGIECNDTLGKTMVLVWSTKGQQLLESAMDLVIDRQLGIDDIKHSIDWDDMLKRQALTDYYAGCETPFRVSLAGRIDRLQTSFYEKILERVWLPGMAYKVLAHLPDIGGMCLSEGVVSHFFNR